MAEVVPFKGVLFNVPKVSKSSGEELLAPPYDIITPEHQQELNDRSPYNIVRIDFGKKYPDDSEQENRYTRAKALLDSWLRKKPLFRVKLQASMHMRLAIPLNADSLL